MGAFLMPLAFIFLAELGDKSMLLALAFATKYTWQTVLSGVFVATSINHLLVVILGTYITNLVSMEYISIICSLAFIFFGLWTIKGDVLDEDDTKGTRFSPFWTVAIAFFLSEMGDKTQLATLTLAVEYKNLMFVWIGTTLGMVLADGVGIALGKILGDNIPEALIKWVAAAIFIFFGFYGLYQSIISYNYGFIIISVIFFITIIMVYFLQRPRKIDK